MNLKREEIIQPVLRDVISHHFSMPETKLLTSKKSWLLLQRTDHKSSCDVDLRWIKKDGCETVAFTLFTAFSQGEVFSLVLKPEEFS
jgi:hypothetical protein